MSPPPEKQRGQPQLGHTSRAAQGIQTVPGTVLPLTPSIQLMKKGWELGGLGTHLHIRVRAATHDFPTYSKIQLLETETKQI